MNESGLLERILSGLWLEMSWEVGGVSSRTFLLGLSSVIALPVFAFFLAVGGLLLNIYWVHGLLVGGVLASALGVYFLKKLPSAAVRTRGVLLVSLMLPACLWIPLLTFVLFKNSSVWEEVFNTAQWICLATLLIMSLVYFSYHLIQRFNSKNFRVIELRVWFWQLLGYLGFLALVPSVAFIQLQTGGLIAAGFTNTNILVRLGDIGVLKLSDERILDLAMHDVSLWPHSLPKKMSPNVEISDTLKNIRHRDDKWSWVESAEKFALRENGQSFSDGISVDYKYEYEKYQIEHVMQNSPAFLAGLKRGDFLVARDSENNFTFKKKDGSLSIINLSKENFTSKDVEFNKILEVNGSKVGYVVFNTFDSYSWKDLKVVLADFHDKQINELVLDLRYNGGGIAKFVGLLGGAIGGHSLDGKLALQWEKNVRYRYLRKEPYGKKVYFSSEPNTSLNMKRLFVITSPRTCSASEALIKALSPYMPVIRIGSETCGKPFGSYPFVYGNKAYFLISFEAHNSKGVGRYVDGLWPDCRAKDDLNHPLGDREEDSLANALAAIETGRCKSNSAFQAQAQ